MQATGSENFRPRGIHSGHFLAQTGQRWDHEVQKRPEVKVFWIWRESRGSLLSIKKKRGGQEVMVPISKRREGRGREDPTP